MKLCDVIMVDCAGACGRSVPLKQAVCRACVEAIMEWCRTYDGPAQLSDEGELVLTQAFARVLGDPEAV